MSIFVLEQHYLSLSPGLLSVMQMQTTLQENAAAQGSQHSTEIGDKLERGWKADFYVDFLTITLLPIVSLLSGRQWDLGVQYLGMYSSIPSKVKWSPHCAPIMSSHMKLKEKTEVWSCILIFMKQAISTENCSSSMTIILARKIIPA